jgi:VanZ family protein
VEKLARLRPLWPAAFWCCALAVLALALVPEHEPATIEGLDKVHHVVAFATLALLAAVAWPARWSISLPALLAYGWTIEVLQSFTATRTADVEDVVADAAGLVLAWFIVQGVRRIRAQGRGKRNLGVAKS